MWVAFSNNKKKKLKEDVVGYSNVEAWLFLSSFYDMLVVRV